jgi:hypothetical protein
MLHGIVKRELANVGAKKTWQFVMQRGNRRLTACR